MILQVENPQNTILQLMNHFSKVTGYKINIKKINLKNASKERSKNEIEKNISFTIASKKRIKYLGINSTKKIQDLYIENYKTSRNGE